MKMSTENYLRELRWKEINALRAEVEDWKDNYNKATDACVALRAENARLRERLRFDDEEPYAQIDSPLAENAKLREALEEAAKELERDLMPFAASRVRAALQKDEGDLARQCKELFDENAKLREALRELWQIPVSGGIVAHPNDMAKAIIKARAALTER